MAKSVLVVESPAKARTLKKYLGDEFQTVASMGHVIDLPERRLGVEIGDNFIPKYEVVKGRLNVINDIKKAVKRADNVYLAPDPDREGEAIACHMADLIKEVLKKGAKIHRVLFNEITKKAVLEALDNPQELDQHRFESQQTRRILDRLVGYKISPLLWRKIKRGLSAGRVQSVALKVICERDEEHRKFEKEEYWTILCSLVEPKSNEGFDAAFWKVSQDLIQIPNEESASKWEADLNDDTYKVVLVQKKQRKRSPVPPFNTSSLQQEAYRKLGFTAKKTMMVAQRLYEGIAVGEEGPIGLITYMRTDSFRSSPQAVDEIRSFIEGKYGKDFLPKKPVVYKSKKNIQDAHEAIRPTSIEYPPSTIKEHLQKDDFMLYRLIWNRFVASQMNPSISDQTTLEMEGVKRPELRLRATGSVLKFKGFLSVYEEGIDEDGGNSKKSKKAPDTKSKESGYNNLLPDLKKGEILHLKKADKKQHFTQPPPLYNDSSIVKELELKGIGRPSTYATIISNIQDKQYVLKEQGRFVPTDLGRVVTDLLVEHFPTILDVGFTADMENKLDAIEENQKDWQSVLHDFYKGFEVELKNAEDNMRNLKREEIPTDIDCEVCQKNMVIKWGKNGSFLACSAFPGCKNTKEFKKDENGNIVIIEADRFGTTCERCSKDMVIKNGRFGRFVACEGYPDCNNTKPFTIGVPCQEEGCSGEFVERKSRTGKLFWSCINYPKCRFASWNLPLKEKCPDCGANLSEKKSKKRGTEHVCLKNCGFVQSVSTDDD